MSDAVTAQAIVEITTSTTWGRASKAGWDKTLGAFLIVAGVPTWLHMNWIALEQYDGSIVAALKAASEEGPVKFAFGHFPQFSLPAITGYAAWLLLQAFFYGYQERSATAKERLAVIFSHTQQTVCWHGQSLTFYTSERRSLAYWTQL